MAYVYSTEWFKGVPPEDVAALQQNIISAQKVLDKVREIVYNSVVAKENVRFDDYDTPSWSHKMAHRNGYIEGLKWINRLLTITDDKNVTTQPNS